jgi:hypothetical protein
MIDAQGRYKVPYSCVYFLDLEPSVARAGTVVGTVLMDRSA